VALRTVSSLVLGGSTPVFLSQPARARDDFPARQAASLVCDDRSLDLVFDSIEMCSVFVIAMEHCCAAARKGEAFGVVDGEAAPP
jgi:hypothetical protein